MSGKKFEAGRVVYFNATKKYGFIQLLDKEVSYFFHMRDGRPFTDLGRIVDFEPGSASNSRNAVRQDYNPVVDEPKRGDVLIFSGWEKQGGCHAPKVLQWGFKSDLEEVMSRIKCSTPPPIAAKR